MCKVYDEHKKFANKTNKDLISYNILLLKLMYLVLRMFRHFYWKTLQKYTSFILMYLIYSFVYFAAQHPKHKLMFSCSQNLNIFSLFILKLD